MFKFTPNKCPDCGKEMRGTVEKVKGCAEMFEDQDHPGHFEYSGSTDIWWDEQRTIRNPENDDQVEVVCHCGNSWWAKMEEVPIQETSPALPTDLA